MRPLAFLHCVARAVLKGGANLLGFGLGDVIEAVWNDWNKETNEGTRKAELQALVQMAAGEFRQQVEAIVREVAGPQPAAVQQRVSLSLQQIPELVRQSFRRPEDQQGRSVPPGLRLRQASDLALLLSVGPSRPATPTLPGISAVTLTTLRGLKPGEVLVYTDRTTCLVGRDGNCQILFPTQAPYSTISRYHCLLDINPPDIIVRDLGSRNGTYVNGQLLDKRPLDMDHLEARTRKFKEQQLKDGDELSLCDDGVAAFRVNIFTPPLPVDPAGSGRGCAVCGRDVSDVAVANRPGEMVCSACRGNLERLLGQLQGPGRNDTPTIPAIRGYTMRKLLGRGGMGAVWLAERGDTPVAVKVMLPEVAADERAVSRFLGEMTEHRRLNHRNVVRLLDTGYARGVFFLILEYCDGGSVADLMKQRGGTLPVDEAVEITLQILEGLHHGHTALGPGRYLVHRDLKPANIFLAGGGSSRIAKVGDYGLAKSFDEAGLSGSTRTGDVGGTAAFLCRQQVIDFKRAGPEVDVWAAAASLYGMLTGRAPRNFPEDRDPWLMVLETAPIHIHQRKADVPAKLAAVIDLALVDSAELHFKTARQFREALEDAF